MLDSDLSKIFGYEVKRLNEQLKQNIEKFQTDFMFRLAENEIPNCLKSQFATLNNKGNIRGQHIKKLPYCSTEQGNYKLVTVLKCELATKQTLTIIRTLV